MMSGSYKYYLKQCEKNKKYILEHLDSLSDINYMKPENVRSYEEEFEIIKVRFTLPKYLEKIDWLPKYKREVINTEIKSVEYAEKQLLHWSATDNGFILFYYDPEKNLYYEMLYHFVKPLINPGLTTVTILKTKEEVC